MSIYENALYASSAHGLRKEAVSLRTSNKRRQRAHRREVEAEKLRRSQAKGNTGFLGGIRDAINNIVSKATSSHRYTPVARLPHTPEGTRLALPNGTAKDSLTVYAQELSKATGLPAHQILENEDGFRRAIQLLGVNRRSVLANAAHKATAENPSLGKLMGKPGVQASKLEAQKARAAAATHNDNTPPNAPARMSDVNSGFGSGSTSIGPWTDGELIWPRKKRRLWPWLVGGGTAATAATAAAVKAAKDSGGTDIVPVGDLNQQGAPGGSEGAPGADANSGGMTKEDIIKYAIYGGVPTLTAATGAMIAGKGNRLIGGATGGILGIPLAKVLHDVARKYDIA